MSCILSIEGLRAENTKPIQLELPDRSVFMFLMISMKSFCNDINIVNIINLNELKEIHWLFILFFSPVEERVVGFQLFALLSTIRRLFHDLSILNIIQSVSTVGLTPNELKP